MKNDKYMMLSTGSQIYLMEGEQWAPKFALPFLLRIPYDEV